MRRVIVWGVQNLFRRTRNCRVETGKVEKEYRTPVNECRFICEWSKYERWFILIFNLKSLIDIQYSIFNIRYFPFSRSFGFVITKVIGLCILNTFTLFLSTWLQIPTGGIDFFSTFPVSNPHTGVRQKRFACTLTFRVALLPKGRKKNLHQKEWDRSIFLSSD